VRIGISEFEVCDIGDPSLFSQIIPSRDYADKSVMKTVSPPHIGVGPKDPETAQIMKEEQ